jgi:phosphoglycolate phosphatase-like HAD superfamily hydrolase
MVLNELKYRLLLVDHDDTAVANSTKELHYVSYLEIMECIRPNIKPLTLDGFFEKVFDSSLGKYYSDEMHFSIEEMQEEGRIWRKNTQDIKKFPGFYPGYVEAMLEYKERGGYFVVVSASEPHVIRMHYQVGTDHRLKPDYIFGHNSNKEHNKPHPYPINKSYHSFELEDILVVDDSKPGLQMARNAGKVTFAAAAWSKSIPEKIKEYMKSNSDFYIRSIPELKELILQEKQETKK